MHNYVHDVNRDKNNLSQIEPWVEDRGPGKSKHNFFFLPRSVSDIEIVILDPLHFVFSSVIFFFFSFSAYKS